MKKTISTTIMTLGFTILSLNTFGQAHNKIATMENKTTKKCTSDCCKAKNESKELTCKLTSPELQKRKETVLKSLKAQVIEKKELENGFAYKFPGSDKMLDELTEFIKTERACCDFFVFGLSIGGDKSEAWLKLTGPEGTKEMITSELGL